MIRALDDQFPAEITRTTLYHVVRLGLRLYVATIVLVSIYSVFWLAEIAGLIPERLLSTIWIAVAVMGAVFVVLLVALFYGARSSSR
ncbi:hypothetical protein [Natrarchaeobaculum aegyptiacum]|uniref:Uncharacterized protein n=1 Tax=Natrarchaeobaculum aegyptiacum TaxID=745377 RepID=A0A2Z2HXI9_9EURY|nr:hypothetical protein [Natrarchaeobaculum aegyptiacum]ARS91613.1 hypothetical protein B1756_00770 [Natrarchaeobaculum aegyptiacum]